MAGKVDPKQIAQVGATANQVLAWDNTASKWVPVDNTIAFLGFGSNNVGTSATTRFLHPWFEDSVAPITVIQYRVPRACTLRNLRIRHNVVGVGAVSISYTVRKNSVATAIVASLLATASDGSDLTNTATFAAGDLIDIQVTKAAITTSPVSITASLEAIA